jgi:hypothetical protein
MSNYSITSVRIRRKTVWLLKDGDKIIARGKSKNQVAKVLMFIMGI